MVPAIEMLSAPRLLGLALMIAACGAPPAPALFGPGVFSTPAWDFFVAFTPDQRRAFVCRADDTFTRYEILETHLDPAGRWTPPIRPPFAARWSNADPHLTPDGRRVFFISNRPDPGEAGERATYDIFVAARGADGQWGEPARLPAPVNDPTTDEWSPSIAASGNLYFGAERRGGRGGLDLWVSRFVDGAYQPAENLGDAINTAGNEVEPWIAPDESYLIFSAVGRRDNLGRYDLYLSRRSATGWTAARRLAAPINTPASEYNHSVSPDGRWLYFSSTRGNGKTGDIYRVPMTAVLGG
jgi:Tol biopolymer transport system component